MTSVYAPAFGIWVQSPKMGKAAALNTSVRRALSSLSQVLRPAPACQSPQFSPKQQLLESQRKTRVMRLF